jgi:phospholipid/cholesterol/gamma-HCH transport system substrate-binding protein
MKQITEAIAGLFVLLVAAGFIFFAYEGANIKSHSNNYSLIAKFSQADGVTIGTDVKISGVKVGHVSKEYLDTDSFKAVVEISLDPAIKLPADSSAQIVSDGLLGGKYLSIAVGADDKILTAGQEIKYTQSSVNLETLIGKMIFNSPDHTANK